MNDDEWIRLKGVFEAVLDTSPERRMAMVNGLRQVDSNLASEIWSLMRADAAATREGWWPVGGARVPTEPRPNSKRFVVCGRLGGGGSGVVYLARDRATDNWVALKMLRSMEPLTLVRFRQEFMLMAGLKLPGTVRVHELFVDATQAYFSMELVRGKPIVAALEAASRMDGRRAVEIGPICRAFVQLAVGIAALHRAGLVHCDLKPSNVYVTQQGRVVILDFGLATQARVDRAVIGRCLGTPAYIDQEIIERQMPTAASDWYAFGAMLYQVLTGIRPKPYPGSARHPRPSIRPVLVAHPPLERLCVALLDRDPGVRPTASEICATLGREAARIRASCLAK